MRRNSKLLLKILSGTFLVGLITSCGCQRTADDSSNNDSSADNSSEVVSSHEDASSNESYEVSSEQSLLPTSIEDAFARGLAGYKSTVFGKDHDLSYKLTFGMPEYFLIINETLYTYNHNTNEFAYANYSCDGDEISDGELQKYYLQNEKGIYFAHEFDGEDNAFTHVEVNDVISNYFQIFNFRNGISFLESNSYYFKPLLLMDTYDEASTIMSSMVSTLNELGELSDVEMTLDYATYEDNSTYDLLFTFSYSNDEIGTNGMNLTLTFDAHTNAYIYCRGDMLFYVGTKNENVITTLIEISEEFNEEIFNFHLNEVAIPEVELPNPYYAFDYVRCTGLSKESGFSIRSFNNENPEITMNNVIGLLNSNFGGGHSHKYYTQKSFNDEFCLMPSDTPLTETEIHDLAVALAKGVYSVPTDIGPDSYARVSVSYNFDNVSALIKECGQALLEDSRELETEFGVRTSFVLPNTFLRDNVRTLMSGIDFEWRVNGEITGEVFTGEPGVTYDMTVTYNLTDSDMLLILTSSIGM